MKIGNCGSPIETEAGWLVITHGVGPMRKYCIGAILLDLRDPARIIGQLKEPLLRPEANKKGRLRSECCLFLWVARAQRSTHFALWH